jgi:uncharacterized FlaG/YvyC family protein
MGQVTGTAPRAVSLPETQNVTRTPEDRARTQAIVSAVRVLNTAGAAGAGREVTYSTDAATKRLVISVVDKQTKEVYAQWPSDYALQMAREFKKEHTDNESLL